jgi:hypothetical protein
MVEGEGVDAYACPDKLGLFGFEEQFRSNTNQSIPNQSNHSFSLSLYSSLCHSLFVALCCLIHTHTQHIQNLHREESPYPRPSSFFYSFCGLVRKRAMYVASMRKSFKDSLKLLEADIQHANTLLVLSLSLSLFNFHSIFSSFNFSYNTIRVHFISSFILINSSLSTHRSYFPPFGLGKFLFLFMEVQFYCLISSILHFYLQFLLFTLSMLLCYAMYHLLLHLHATYYLSIFSFNSMFSSLLLFFICL